MKFITSGLYMALTISLAALLPVSSVLAEPKPAQTELSVLVFPSGSIPNQIFGIDCKQEDGDSNSDPMLMCSPPDILKQPTIAAFSGEWKRPMSRSELIDVMREPFHERTMFKVIREEPFAPVADPQAIGLRALYQTDLGNRYVWALLSQGKLTQVIATVFAPADFGAMKADIELKVFGVPERSGTKTRTIKR